MVLSGILFCLYGSTNIIDAIVGVALRFVMVLQQECIYKMLDD